MQEAFMKLIVRKIPPFYSEDQFGAYADIYMAKRKMIF